MALDDTTIPPPGHRGPSGPRRPTTVSPSRSGWSLSPVRTSAPCCTWMSRGRTCAPGTGSRRWPLFPGGPLRFRGGDHLLHRPGNFPHRPGLRPPGCGAAGIPAHPGLAGLLDTGPGGERGAHLSPECGAPGQGLVTGNRTDLSDSFNTDLQRTGLTHTVAVSGSHLVLLAGLLSLLLAAAGGGPLWCSSPCPSCLP